MRKLLIGIWMLMFGLSRTACHRVEKPKVPIPVEEI